MRSLLKAFLYSLVLAFLSLLSVSLLWKNAFMLTVVLIIVSAVMLIIWRDREDLYLYLFVGISGALAESVAIWFGAWTYTSPDWIGIPVWLPILWGVTGVFIKKISMEIHDFSKRHFFKTVTQKSF